ncbi:MAG: ATP-binding protein [Synechococcus sp. SB0668_bin_15]|nr:ATP-binding protein [Synechococcus sp. SB0668_bin_15]MYC50652.1 ATP-binding protein [Synechococcus sp. SB0662_bin_14]
MGLVTSTGGAWGSSGLRRILALSYLLVWAWQEHQLASALLGKDPARQVVFLIDEVEVHLHPSWQRRIVRSLLKVLSELNRSTSV